MFLLQTETTSATAAAWIGTMASVVAVSLLALVGALSLVVRRETLHRLLPYAVSIAVGSLLGNAFLHLIPETAHDGFEASTGGLILAGMVLFFAFERFVHAHDHGHSGHARVAPYAWLNLAGDGLHNFADGLILAAAWMQGPALGISTTIAVALHEIPQELGDVGVLLHAGVAPRRAVALNLLTGFVSVLGGAVGLLLAGRIEGFEDVVLAVTAGGFVYVAAADLMPELHRERRLLASFAQVACLLGGIGLMALLDGH